MTGPVQTVGTDQVTREAVQEVMGNSSRAPTDAEIFKIQAVYDAKVAWYRRRDIAVVIPPAPNGGSAMGNLPATNGRVVKQYAKELLNSVNANTAAILNLPATVVNNQIYDWSTDFRHPAFEDRSTTFQLWSFTPDVYQLPNDVIADPNAEQHTQALTNGIGAVYSIGGYWLMSEEILATRSQVPAHLEGGAGYENIRLSELGLSKNTGTFRPTEADVNSAAFKVIVGPPQYTAGGLLRGTIVDVAEGGSLEIKSGGSMLSSTYQLRLQTYRALKEDAPLTIETTRPPNPSFDAWLKRWGVIVKAPR